MPFKISLSSTVADVKQIIQIKLLQQKNDLDKNGVIKLYEDLERMMPPEGDAYIPSSTGKQAGNTYKP